MPCLAPLGDMNFTSPSTYSHRRSGFPAARNCSHVNAVLVRMLPPTALLPQESSLRFPDVLKFRTQRLRQPALDFGCNQTRRVETSYVDTVLVPIRTQLLLGAPLRSVNHGTDSDLFPRDTIDH